MSTGAATESARPAQRGDASRNRARILEAAREALAISGDATMQSIAKKAGIGQGTMYRHFPTREALIMAVHRNDVDHLVATAPLLLKTQPAATAIREWLDMLASYGRVKHGLAGALYAVMRTQLADEGYSPITEAIAVLLAAGKAEGTIRDDIAAEEVLLLVGFLWRIEPDDDWEMRTSHLLNVVVDGLRAHSAPTAVS